jgi:hypothetical protein
MTYILISAIITSSRAHELHSQQKIPVEVAITLNTEAEKASGPYLKLKTVLEYQDLQLLCPIV